VSHHGLSNNYEIRKFVSNTKSQRRTLCFQFGEGKFFRHLPRGNFGGTKRGFCSKRSFDKANEGKSMKVSKKDLLNQLFRNGLYLALASEGNDEKKCASLCNEYDMLTETGNMGGQGATGIIYAAYGSQNPRATLDNIKEYVQGKLVELGHETPNRFDSPVRTLNEASGSIVSEWIGQQLGKLGKAPAPETCTKKRFAELLKRINSNIDKCSIQVNNQDLSDFARAQSRIKIADCFREPMTNFSATASHVVNGKEFKEFALEVR
jgi:hypothetical protein